MDTRNVGYWFFGSLSLLLAVLIGSNSGILFSNSQTDIMLSLVISLLLIMFGGLLWIGASVNIREK